MRVKNLFVRNKKSAMDCIERFLCTIGISYVKIENEIHCADLILRFYNFKAFKEETLSLGEKHFLEDAPSIEMLDIRGTMTRNSEFLYFHTFEGTRKEKIKKICSVRE